MVVLDDTVSGLRQNRHLPCAIGDTEIQIGRAASIGLAEGITLRHGSVRIGIPEKLTKIRKFLCDLWNDRLPPAQQYQIAGTFSDPLDNIVIIDGVFVTAQYDWMSLWGDQIFSRGAVVRSTDLTVSSGFR